TDGQEFLNRKVDLFLDSLTLSGNVPSAYYVFVGSTNLKSHTNERNKLFFCNADFLNFFENTLIPMVERQIGQTFIPAQRGLLGISFGGLNAAYFAAKGHAFKRFGLLSPITYPCREINQSILFSDRSNLRLFISTGTNDAEQYTQELIPLFQSKGHTVQTLQTPGNHDFENWLEQLPKAIRFLADH
ncbi:MAG: alpha/beta hydrolase-fold protein, partial [Bacteroidota bacterium]